MTEPTPQTTEPKTKRQPYAPIPKRQMRTIDHCTRSSDLVIPSVKKRADEAGGK
ncbi:hypothetical protein [Synechococcus sp. GEYO]|uniref:hypothetical protein n=1 Tax=Synechococcus sp. GEYO TaxID=2575511 RepID=UPI001482E848|nr:hypothetical protein [Synechococcus sp. GEYO]